MGMVLDLRTVSDETLTNLFADPDAIDAVYSDEGVEDGPPLTDEGLNIDLDKAWHAIHYLLTGSASEGEGPLAFLLSGGMQIGDVEVGYGPARGMTSAQVHVAAAAISLVPASLLASRFNGAAMDAAGVYPKIWKDGEGELDYILEYFGMLQQFMSDASSKNMAVLLVLT